MPIFQISDLYEQNEDKCTLKNGNGHKCILKMEMEMAMEMEMVQVNEENSQYYV